MTNTKLDSCLDFVLEKMKGNLILLNNTTEEDEIEYYKIFPHVNYFLESDKGFLCVVELEVCTFVDFAWYDGSYTAHKQMVKLGKELYQHYTIEQDKPIYYSGLKNFYKHHSIEVNPNLWQFSPKL